MAALQLKTPGVFIEEVPTLPASVVQVETAIPAFIGYTEKGETLPPTRIISFNDYEDLFGGPDKRVGITIETGPQIKADSVIAYGLQHLMYYSVRMFFNNGGGPCYIVSAGGYPEVDNLTSSVQVSKPDLTTALDSLEKEDEPTLLLFPDAVNLTTRTIFYSLIKEALGQCNKLQDRFTITDVYPDKDPLDSLDPVDLLRDEIGTQDLKYGAAYYPNLKTILPFQFNSSDADIIIDNELNSGINEEKTLAQAITDGDVDDPGLADLIRAAIVAAEFDKLTVEMPPGGAMAGIYATVDRTRGVWKAPANISLNSVIGPSLKITAEEQGRLNVHSTGKSVNAIRAFTGKGVLVWGSRTLAGNDNEWRYVPVRRLFIMAEESIEKATRAVVFEPNDANTWLRTKTMIENFLSTLWRQGALAGAKPEDAYFVNVGLGETMTSLDILEGRLIIEVGMAAVRPAEFIILRFSHKLQES